jgi:tyrosyl-tRNA synthetase
VDPTRRQHRGKAFGLTLPLVTKADGTKFGKTESGTIWLDANRTSPYAFYQFWLNSADADVYRFLRYFTFLSVDEIDAIEVADRERAGRPEAQGILAREVTRLVHGDEGLLAAERISRALFSGDIGELSAGDLAQLSLDGLPSSHLPAEFGEQSLINLLVDAGMSPSGKPVKDALGRNAVLVNGEGVGIESNGSPAEVFDGAKALHGRFFIVRLGKKKYHLFELAA